jgi:hypothetical protein
MNISGGFIWSNYKDSGIVYHIMLFTTQILLVVLIILYAVFLLCRHRFEKVTDGTALNPLDRYPFWPMGILSDKLVYARGTVKSQKNDCGSCWAVSFCSMAEYRVMPVRRVFEFSKILHKIEGMGCQGGTLTGAGQVVLRDGLYDTRTRSVFYPKQIYSVPSYAIAYELQTNGPIAMHFHTPLAEAEHSMRMVPEDGDNTLSHAVVVVGFCIKRGLMQNELFLLIENSWGSGWGDGGRQWLKFNRSGFEEAVALLW